MQIRQEAQLVVQEEVTIERPYKCQYQQFRFRDFHSWLLGKTSIDKAFENLAPDIKNCFINSNNFRYALRYIVKASQVSTQYLRMLSPEIAAIQFHALYDLSIAELKQLLSAQLDKCKILPAKTLNPKPKRFKPTISRYVDKPYFSLTLEKLHLVVKNHSSLERAYDCWEEKNQYFNKLSNFLYVVNKLKGKGISLTLLKPMSVSAAVEKFKEKYKLTLKELLTPGLLQSRYSFFSPSRQPILTTPDLKLENIEGLLTEEIKDTSSESFAFEPDRANNCPANENLSNSFFDLNIGHFFQAPKPPVELLPYSESDPELEQAFQSWMNPFSAE